jgi:hypothetical protein
MTFTKQLRLLEVMARTSGKSALHAALPLYFLICIVAVIIFAGHGMDASSVTSLALGSSAVRMPLLVGWAMLTLPVARVLVADPQTFFLRTLPLPRWWLLGITGSALALVQLPWLVLWVRGSGAASAAIALFAVLGAQMYALAGVYGIVDCAGLASIALGWQLAPSLLSLALLVPAFLVGQRLAWLRALEPKSQGRHRVLTTTAWLAAATAFGISAYRSNASAAARALALGSLAFVITSLGLRNNPEWTRQTLLSVASALWGAACLLGSVALARPMLQAEAELASVLDACGASSVLRAGSSIGLLTLLAAAAGCVFGLGITASASSHWAHGGGLTVQLALGGAAWAALGAAVIRMTTTGTGQDSGRQLLALLGLYGLALMVLLASPIAMLILLSGTAALVSTYATRFPCPGGVARGRRV